MKQNQIIHGFSVIRCQKLTDLGAKLYQMEHKKSGARLVWLDRKDANKTFGIAFRTLPEDDTGVFHILEHSVLCGSERYPVKEPFVELLKSSMQTFLNAMTFPDKTFYPVSSRNDQDFRNLMRVYMDAVFHPAVYQKPEIFYQEGWHYEFDGNDMPFYKGVVFNEMKGASASPDSVMQKALCRQLFPDTPYRFVSGGDPACIPELTYEAFVDSHRRFYHPSNAYILLDGSVEIETVLRILDEEYLSAYEKSCDQPAIPVQKPVKPDPLRIRYEVSPNESSGQRAVYTEAYVIGDYRAKEELMALRILSDVLCGSNQAPLKKCILSAGLAQDVYLDVMDGIQQPFVMVQLRNMDEGRTAEAASVLHDELRRLVQEGVDHEQLTATLAYMEFQMRERDYGGMPRGLGLCMSMLDSWLYGGDPADNLEVGSMFRSLNEKVDENYFEQLLERVFFQNDHCCCITMAPSDTLGEEQRQAEAERLQAAKLGWTADDIAALKKLQADLARWQVSSDAPEALASLPQLQLSDISTEPERIPTEEKQIAGRPLLLHPLYTDGICYTNLYFDISDLQEEQLPAVSFLCTLLGEMDTTGHTNLELQKLRRLYFGDLRFAVEAYSADNQPDDCRTSLCISFSALEANLEPAARLVQELISETVFEDTDRILEYLNQHHTYLEQSVVRAGHRFAMRRVTASATAQGVVQECSQGFTYCRWLKELKNNYKDRAHEQTKILAGLCKMIFVRDRLTVSITGTKKGAADVLEQCVVLQLPTVGKMELQSSIHPWEVKKEGVIVPADVSFAALGGNLVRCGSGFSGIAQVFGKVVSLAYLWNVIRVQGGAYGTGMMAGPSGNVGFYSYRDPDAVRSLACCRETAQFVRKFCSEEPDLTGFIIGAVSDSDPLLLPQGQGKQADTFYFRGIRYEDRCRRRQEMLSAVPKQLLPIADALETMKGGVCVIGSRQQVEACEELEVVHTL